MILDINSIISNVLSNDLIRSVALDCVGVALLRAFKDDGQVLTRAPAPPDSTCRHGLSLA